MRDERQSDHYTPDGWRYTEHARLRRIQRSMPADAIDLVLAYGREKRVRGASQWQLDKRSRAQIKFMLGQEKYVTLAKHLDITVIQADDGCLVTGYRRKPRQTIAYLAPAMV